MRLTGRAISPRLPFGCLAYVRIIINSKSLAWGASAAFCCSGVAVVVVGGCWGVWVGVLHLCIGELHLCIGEVYTGTGVLLGLVMDGRTAMKIRCRLSGNDRAIESCPAVTALVHENGAAFRLMLVLAVVPS